jgi:hypothetical protein
MVKINPPNPPTPTPPPSPDPERLRARIAGRAFARDVLSTGKDVVAARNPEFAIAYWECIRDEAMMAVARLVPQPPAKEQKKAKQPTEFTADVTEALEMAERIEELAAELPEAGSEFGESVKEKAGDIADNIHAHGRVTEAQQQALENMLYGVQKWFGE